MITPMSSPYLPSLLVFLGVAMSFVACDSTEVRDPDVFVADFYFEGADARPASDAGNCETFEDEEFCFVYSLEEQDARSYEGGDDDSQIQEGIREMLNGADNGMAVIAYWADPDFDDQGNVTRATYYALPHVDAFEDFALVDGEEDLVTIVTTLSYAFDDADFYFDIGTSDGVTATTIADSELTEFIDIRLVTIPGDVIYQGSALRANLAELYPTYSDLARAYDLPERPMPRRVR